MKIKLTRKDTGEERQLEAIYFDRIDGSVSYVTTIDPKTGHDPADDPAESFNWDITCDENDMKKWTIQTLDGEIIYEGNRKS